MSEGNHSTRPFADRLREAVDEGATRGVRAGRGRQARRSAPVFSPLANPDRVRYSDELFVDRIRRALD